MLASKLTGQKKLLSGYRPSVPITYFYAKKKPFQFQGKKWEMMVKKSGGTIEGIDCGHWIMLEAGHKVIGAISKQISPKL